MASHLSPRRSLLSLLRKQLQAVPEAVLSMEARQCLDSYFIHLERMDLDRPGDHMLAALGLNAAEIACYIPSGKLGKGSMELTRLEERIERVLTAARKLEQRPMRKGTKAKAAWCPRKLVRPPTRRMDE